MRQADPDAGVVSSGWRELTPLEGLVGEALAFFPDDRSRCWRVVRTTNRSRRKWWLTPRFRIKSTRPIILGAGGGSWAAPKRTCGKRGPGSPLSLKPSCASAGFASCRATRPRPAPISTRSAVSRPGQICGSRADVPRRAGGARGDAVSADQLYRESLALMPVAQAPSLALSRLADSRGDLRDARRWLQRSFVAVGPRREDPWWADSAGTRAASRRAPGASARDGASMTALSAALWRPPSCWGNSRPARCSGQASISCALTHSCSTTAGRSQGSARRTSRSATTACDSRRRRSPW